MKFFAILGVAFYLICSTVYLDLPGLYYDETIFVNAALGNVDGSFIELEAPIGSHRLPVMLMPYIGALKAYLYWPIFALFGTSPATIRLPVILFGFITLIFTFLIVRSTLGKNVAFASLILLATDPTFIFTNKLDFGPTSIMMLLKVSSLYLLFRWIHQGKKSDLLLAFLILGLGTYEKGVFLWYVAAVTVSFLLFFWPRIKPLISLRALVCCIGLIVLFCIPMIYSNIKSSWNVFEKRRVFNTSLIQTFNQRYVLFNDTLNGRAIFEWVNYNDFKESLSQISKQPSTSPISSFAKFAGMIGLNGTLLPIAVLITVLWILLLWVTGRLRKKNYVLFFLCLMIIISFLIYITAMATGAHHVLMIYPFPHILIAFLVGSEPSARSDRSILKLQTIKYLCLIILLLSNLAVNTAYLSSFSIRGGAGFWSDAIYDLAQFVKTQKDKNFILMGWGFNNPLLALGVPPSKKQEFFLDYKNDGSEDVDSSQFYSLFVQSDAFLVFYAPEYEREPILESFKKAAIKLGYKNRLVKTFFQRDLRPVYLVYEVTRPDVRRSSNDSMFVKFEAEEWLDKLGGSIGDLNYASQGKVLANFWGENLSDFATYRVSIPKDLQSAVLCLRYAYEESDPQKYYLYIDDKLTDVIALQSTNGWGYTLEQWMISCQHIGSMKAGLHQFTIKPSIKDQVTNFDFFALCDNETTCMDHLSRFN